MEITVEEEGQPKLGQEGEQDVQAQQQQTSAAALPVVLGWTPQEAAQVVGGVVANLTLALYAIRWHAPPAAELWPAIAGNPTTEFPLMGAGLAPVLDFMAPKGSAAAIGVSLTAGLGELVGAIARRSSVLDVPPPAKPSPGATPSSPAPTTAPAEASPGSNGFRFRGPGLEVLDRAESPLAGMGIETA